MLINSITFGYSASEDRISLQLTLENHTIVRLWLTRRLCQKLCKSLPELLEKEIYPEGQKITNPNTANNYLRKEFFEITQSLWDQPSTSKNNLNKPILSQLCNSIEIKSGKSWEMIFKSNEDRYQLKTSRQQSLKILLAFIKKMKHAHWDVPLPQSWINNQKI